MPRIEFLNENQIFKIHKAWSFFRPIVSDDHTIYHYRLKFTSLT